MPAVETEPAETVADDYLALIHRRPLRPVRDDEDYDRAVEIIYAIDGRAERGESVSEGERDYVETTVLLLADWDEKHNQWPSDEIPLPDRLRALLDNRGADESLLAQVAGMSRAEMDEVLAGRAELSKEAIKRLAAEFRVGAEYLL